MSRLRGLHRDDLDDEQRALYDAIVESRRGGGTFELRDADGALAGPFNAMVFAPALGQHWSAIGARLRFDSVLEQRQVEFIICVVGAHFRADFEFLAHAPLARRAGVDDAVLDALVRGDAPAFVRSDERVLYELVKAMVRAEPVPSDMYAAAEASVHEAGMVEIAALVGYYTALAMWMNLFAIDPPTGERPVWGHPT